MLYLTLAFVALCVFLAVLLSREDSKNVKLVAENSKLKGRMEAMHDKEPDSPEAPLTLDGIADAVRHIGYVPELDEDMVIFMVAGERYYADASRLPTIFIVKEYGLDTKVYEIDLMKEAAHQMSDDLIMLKAFIIEDDGRTGLRFLIAALDANIASLRMNLPRYINIIEDGRRSLNEHYQELVKAKETVAKTINPFATATPAESKITS